MPGRGVLTRHGPLPSAQRPRVAREIRPPDGRWDPAGDLRTDPAKQKIATSRTWFRGAIRSPHAQTGRRRGPAGHPAARSAGRARRACVTAWVAPRAPQFSCWAAGAYPGRGRAHSRPCGLGIRAWLRRRPARLGRARGQPGPGGGLRAGLVRLGGGRGSGQGPGPRLPACPRSAAADVSAGPVRRLEPGSRPRQDRHRAGRSAA
jgi:hypothetical protein